MSASVRITVALLALFAFGLATAVRAWALVPAEPVTVITCMDTMAGECEHGSRDDRDPASDCLSMPAGMTGACSAFGTALPSELLAELPSVATAQRLPAMSDDLPLLILARGLFRPPKA